MHHAHIQFYFWMCLLKRVFLWTLTVSKFLKPARLDCLVRPACLIKLDCLIRQDCLVRQDHLCSVILLGHCGRWFIDASEHIKSRPHNWIIFHAASVFWDPGFNPLLAFSFCVSGDSCHHVAAQTNPTHWRRQNEPLRDRPESAVLQVRSVGQKGEHLECLRMGERHRPCAQGVTWSPLCISETSSFGPVQPSPPRSTSGPQGLQGPAPGRLGTSLALCF